MIKNFYTNVYTQTMTNASFPQKRKGYWSIIVWTMSSKCGLICSKRPISENSMGKRVGHQHMARFFESMLFNLQFSDTLKNKSKHFEDKTFSTSLKNADSNNTGNAVLQYCWSSVNPIFKEAVYYSDKISTINIKTAI